MKKRILPVLLSLCLSLTLLPSAALAAGDDGYQEASFNTQDSSKQAASTEYVYVADFTAIDGQAAAEVYDAEGNHTYILLNGDIDLDTLSLESVTKAVSTVSIDAEYYLNGEKDASKSGKPYEGSSDSASSAAPEEQRKWTAATVQEELYLIPAADDMTYHDVADPETGELADGGVSIVRKDGGFFYEDGTAVEDVSGFVTTVKTKTVDATYRSDAGLYLLTSYEDGSLSLTSPASTEGVSYSAYDYYTLQGVSRLYSELNEKMSGMAVTEPNQFGKWYATAETVYFYVSDGAVTVYTGYEAAPSCSGTQFIEVGNMAGTALEGTNDFQLAAAVVTGEAGESLSGDVSYIDYEAINIYVWDGSSAVSEDGLTVTYNTQRLDGTAEPVSITYDSAGSAAAALADAEKTAVHRFLTVEDGKLSVLTEGIIDTIVNSYDGEGTIVTREGGDYAFTIKDAAKFYGKDFTEISGSRAYLIPSKENRWSIAAAIFLPNSNEPEKPGEPPVEPVEPAKLPYTDVKESDWYSDAVRYMYEAGMMTGTTDTTFSPGQTVDRATIVTMLHRLEGTPAAGAASFPDVAAGQWYSEAVAWASAGNVVTGYDNGSFGPNDPVTREQMAVILLRYLQSKGGSIGTVDDLAAFPDADSVSGYAVDAMRWAVGAGLITGKGSGILDPGGSATRAEVAAILMRFCENVIAE